MTTAPTHDDIMAALTARKHWEQRQATWYQMRHDGLRRRNKPWPNAADMHYPLADGIIEKLKPTYISQIYATDTICSFAALTSDFSTYQAGAAQWFDHQLKQESNFEEEIDIAIDVMAQTGRCPVKIYWDATRNQMVFEAINPLYLIVPAWTAKLSGADWIVHVQRYSKAAYKRLPGFRCDPETIGQILSGDGARDTDSGSYDTQRLGREGLTKGAGDSEIVVWEVFYREEGGAWCVKTYSPTLPDVALRPEFGLPYNQGVFAAAQIPPPFGEFKFEVKERGYYAPRGVCERVAPEEASLSKDWNTMKDHQTLTTAPTFYAKQGVPQGANIRMIPGQILPFEIAAVQFPTLSADVAQGMQFTQRLAEDRLSVPSVGVGRAVDPSKNKTAAETNLISSIMAGSGDVRSRLFRRQLGELLNLAWGIAVQYRRETLDYYFNEELQQLDPAAFTGRYRIEPSGSGDNNNRGLVLQKATSRKQMFAGNPNIDQRELDKSVLEADDPRLVKRLFVNAGTPAAEQIEDQAQEISIMLLGFPAQVRPSDDDDAHLQSMAGFTQRRATLGEELTSETLQLLVAHGTEHLAALKKKAPQIYAQKAPALQQWLQQTTAHAQAAAQEEQIAKAARPMLMQQAEQAMAGLPPPMPQLLQPMLEKMMPGGGDDAAAAPEAGGAPGALGALAAPAAPAAPAGMLGAAA